MESKVEQKLYATLAKLSVKANEKITVSTLCEKADVSRASFYLYYKDIDDFLGKCVEHITEKLYDQVQLIIESASTGDCEMLFNQDDVDLLKAFTEKHSYWGFAEIANSMTSPRFQEEMKARWGEEKYKKYEEIGEFILCGSIGTIYMELLDFDKHKFEKNMEYLRNIVRELLPGEDIVGHK